MKVEPPSEFMRYDAIPPSRGVFPNDPTYARGVLTAIRHGRTSAAGDRPCAVKTTLQCVVANATASLCAGTQRFK